jgi:GxxExxY protein
MRAGAVLDRLANSVIGAAIEVHRILGPGYLESVYAAAMEIELRHRNASVEAQRSIAVDYKGHAVGEGRIDRLVESQFVVELKAVEGLLPIHRPQLLSYLKVTGRKLGLLINFNEEVLRTGVKRAVRTK